MRSLGDSFLSRWLAAPRAVMRANGGEHEDAAEKDADFIVLPPEASDAWRTWLMTGARRPPIDRRRVKGSHKGLKKMLAEGTSTSDNSLQPWNDFSSAMVRQAIDEALNTLPPDHKLAVKLAYFGGLSNEEIAERLGVREAGVRRRLRKALAAVSDHVERGQAMVRKAIYGLALWFSGRWLVDAVRRIPMPTMDQMAQVAVVVGAGAITATLLAGHSPTPAQVTQVEGPRITLPAAPHGAGISLPNTPVNVPAGPLPVSPPVVPTPPIPSLPVKVPVTVPVPVALPSPHLVRLPLPV